MPFVEQVDIFVEEGDHQSMKLAGAAGKARKILLIIDLADDKIVHLHGGPCEETRHAGCDTAVML